MGLPIYREPGDSENKPASASLPEPPSRTIIRRQPTVRRARPAQPPTNVHVSSHGPARARLPPSAFFSFLQSNSRLQELYDRGTSRERSEMVEQFLRSRRLRASDLQQRQPSASRTASAGPQRRSTASSRYFGGHEVIDLEDEGVNDYVPVPGVTSNSSIAEGVRPRSRHGYGTSYRYFSYRGSPQYVTDIEIQDSMQSQSHRQRAPLDASTTAQPQSWNQAPDASQWETLLTTITPDPSLPSAESSFASTAAAFQHEPETSTVSDRVQDSSWQAPYSQVTGSDMSRPPPILISPPSSTSPPPRPLYRRQLPGPADHVCDSESEDGTDTDADSDNPGNAGFVSLIERMIRTGRSTREINNELRDLPWGMISNSSIVSGARRELEILATGGDIPDSFWESAGLMTVLEHERRIADVRLNENSRG